MRNEQVHCCWVCVQIPSPSQWALLGHSMLLRLSPGLEGWSVMGSCGREVQSSWQGGWRFYEKLCLALKPSIKVTFGAINCIVFRMRVIYVVILGPSSESLGFGVCFSSGWFQGWKTSLIGGNTAFCIEASLKGIPGLIANMTTWVVSAWILQVFDLFVVVFEILTCR